MHLPLRSTVTTFTAIPGNWAMSVGYPKYEWGCGGRDGGCATMHGDTAVSDGSGRWCWHLFQSVGASATPLKQTPPPHQRD